jgi:hypothetical protein
MMQVSPMWRIVGNVAIACVLLLLHCSLQLVYIMYGADDPRHAELPSQLVPCKHSHLAA